MRTRENERKETTFTTTKFAENLKLSSYKLVEVGTLREKLSSGRKTIDSEARKIEMEKDDARSERDINLH